MQTRQKLEQTILAVRDEFISDDIVPHDYAGINCGWCADFATRVWELLGKPEWLTFCDDEDLGQRAYSHTFLEHDGLYYDSECPEGVDDWTMLPIFQRDEDEADDVWHRNFILPRNRRRPIEVERV